MTDLMWSFDIYGVRFIVPDWYSSDAGNLQIELIPKDGELEVPDGETTAVMMAVSKLTENEIVPMTQAGYCKIAHTANAARDEYRRMTEFRWTPQLDPTPRHRPPPSPRPRVFFLVCWSCTQNFSTVNDLQCPRCGKYSAANAAPVSHS